MKKILLVLAAILIMILFLGCTKEDTKPSFVPQNYVIVLHNADITWDGVFYKGLWIVDTIITKADKIDTIWNISNELPYKHKYLIHWREFQETIYWQDKSKETIRLHVSHP